MRSPPWHMKPGMIRWKREPLRCSGLSVSSQLANESPSFDSSPRARAQRPAALADALLAGAEGAKVLGSLRVDGGEELKHDALGGLRVPYLQSRRIQRGFSRWWVVGSNPRSTLGLRAEDGAEHSGVRVRSSAGWSPRVHLPRLGCGSSPPTEKCLGSV